MCSPAKCSYTSENSERLSVYCQYQMLQLNGPRTSSLIMSFNTETEQKLKAFDFHNVDILHVMQKQKLEFIKFAQPS